MEKDIEFEKVTVYNDKLEPEYVTLNVPKTLVDVVKNAIQSYEPITTFSPKDLSITYHLKGDDALYQYEVKISKRVKI